MTRILLGLTLLATPSFSWERHPRRGSIRESVLGRKLSAVGCRPLAADRNLPPNVQYYNRLKGKPKFAGNWRGAIRCDSHLTVGVNLLGSCVARG
jgi:hypothetical protein